MNVLKIDYNKKSDTIKNPIQLKIEYIKNLNVLKIDYNKNWIQ